MCKVFLSYAHEDFAEASRLRKRLLSENIDVWFDMESIRGGQDWKYQIEENIDRSSHFIACLTQNYIYKKGYVQVEIRHALRKQQENPPGRSFIIPVRFENIRPLFREIRAIQYIDLFPLYETGFEKLMDALQNEISSKSVRSTFSNQYFCAKQIEEGKNCLKYKNYAGALKHFKVVLDKIPENEEAWLLYCIAEFDGASISIQHPEFIDKINNILLNLVNSSDEGIQRQVMVFLAILRLDYYWVKKKRFSGPDYEEIRKFLLNKLPAQEELEYLSQLNFSVKTRKYLNLFR